MPFTFNFLSNRAVLLVPAVLLFSLYWYGAFLSFPLMSEDGAANYSFLLESYLGREPFTTDFPIKWLEGLGQPNAFVTFTFDPFSWVMLLPMDPADAFRLSMALRATVCWLTTYLFAKALFRGRGDIAVLAAFLNMLLSFIFGHPSGIPTIAGIPNATHSALFPLLLWVVVIVLRRPNWIGWADLALLTMVYVILVTFPLSSVFALGVAFAFAFCLIVVEHRERRVVALRGAGKLVGMAIVLLFAPGIGVWHTWSSLLATFARIVFADELFFYTRLYHPPLLWHGVPLPVRLAIIFALGAFLMRTPWPRGVRVVGLTLLLTVAGTQMWTIAYALGAFDGALDRLPRPHYVEFYMPPFYAVAGGFSLRYWPKLLPVFSNMREALRSAPWLFLFLFTAVGILRPSLAVSAMLAALLTLSIVSLTLNAIHAPASRPVIMIRRGVSWMVQHGRCIAYSLLLGLVLLWLRVWLNAPHNVYGSFAQRCSSGITWCDDEVGPTIAASKSPITSFIRKRLETTGTFRGRADLLLMPHPILVFPVPINVRWTRVVFDRLNFWYARLYELRAPLASYGVGFRKKPYEWKWRQREQLRLHLEGIFLTGAYDIFPENLLKEVREWSDHTHDPTLTVQDSHGQISELDAMLRERVRAVAITGNGMMLRALPVQGIPVASSYEQGMDYLYYLLWTRYLNEGGGAKYERSMNFTALETVHARRLALLGIRYVIAREAVFGGHRNLESQGLSRVMSSQGYAVYEVPEPNLAGFDVRNVIFADSVAEELAVMRGEEFDPRTTAVVSSNTRSILESRKLTPIRDAQISLKGNDLHFEAQAGDQLSLAILPFKFSNCWIATWSSGRGNIMRADVGLIGVAFSGHASLKLHWSAGYSNAGCIREDRTLISQSVQAATRFPN